RNGQRSDLAFEVDRDRGGSAVVGGFGPSVPRHLAGQALTELDDLGALAALVVGVAPRLRQGRHICAVVRPATRWSPRELSGGATARPPPSARSPGSDFRPCCEPWRGSDPAGRRARSCWPAARPRFGGHRGGGLTCRRGR